MTVIPYLRWKKPKLPRAVSVPLPLAILFLLICGFLIIIPLIDGTEEWLHDSCFIFMYRLQRSTFLVRRKLHFIYFSFRSRDEWLGCCHHRCWHSSLLVRGVVEARGQTSRDSRGMQGLGICAFSCIMLGRLSCACEFLLSFLPIVMSLVSL